MKSMENLMVVPENTGGIIGKFFYYSLANILIPKEQFIEQISNSGAFSFQFKNTASGTFDEDFEHPVFTVNLAFKDVRLGIEMCESLGQRVPMMSRAREVFAATAEKYGEENFTATFKML